MGKKEQKSKRHFEEKSVSAKEPVDSGEDNKKNAVDSSKTSIDVENEKQASTEKEMPGDSRDTGEANNEGGESDAEKESVEEETLVVDEIGKAKEDHEGAKKAKKDKEGGTIDEAENMSNDKGEKSNAEKKDGEGEAMDKEENENPNEGKKSKGKKISKKVDKAISEDGNQKPNEEKKSGEKGKEVKRDSEASDEEILPGLFDVPVTVLALKRDRKVIVRYADATPKKNEGGDEETDFSEGKGELLKNIPFIKYQIQMAENEDLVVLHRLMFYRAGKIGEIKKNIRNFCGYPFSESSKHFRPIKTLAGRLTVAGLKFINGLLGLEVSKDGVKMEDDLMEFLQEPKDLGVPVPETVIISPRKSTRTVPVKKKNYASRKKLPRRGSGKHKSYREETASSEEEQDPPKKSARNKSVSSHWHGSSEVETEEEEAPARSNRRSGAKTASKKGTSRGCHPGSDSEEKETPDRSERKLGRKTSKSKFSKIKVSSSDEDTSDDEPLVKKKKAPPTNAELKKVISAMLRKVDLETVTMKSLVRNVSDRFPTFDLSSRKDFIKTTVKDML